MIYRFITENLKIMIQTFTPNHFLLAAYGELPASSARELHTEMLYNEDDEQTFQRIVDVQETLDELRLKPSQTSINIILNYSRSLNS